MNAAHDIPHKFERMTAKFVQRDGLTHLFFMLRIRLPLEKMRKTISLSYIHNSQSISGSEGISATAMRRVIAALNSRDKENQCFRVLNRLL
jgi:dsRNA-specific ribonuclease